MVFIVSQSPAKGGQIVVHPAAAARTIVAVTFSPVFIIFVCAVVCVGVWVHSGFPGILGFHLHELLLLIMLLLIMLLLGLWTLLADRLEPSCGVLAITVKNIRI